MAIELRLVQFSSEIILKITLMISDQIALHSVELPSIIIIVTASIRSGTSFGDKTIG